MQTGRMSRMTTSFASLLWARPAMRRACWREFRVGSGPFFAASLAAVETELGDPGGDRRRHELVDRLAPRHAVAHVTGRDGQRLDLEEAHPIGAFETLQHPAKLPTRIPGPRSDRKPRELEDGV